MNLKVTLGLMIAFMVLGWFALFDPIRRQAKEDEKAERESHVLQLKDQKLAAIEVKSESGFVAIECDTKDHACPFDSGGQWRLTKPEADGADPSAVGTAASTLLNLSHNGKLDFDAPPVDTEFALGNPTVTLRLAGKAEPVTLRFGKKNPTGPNVYLAVSDDPKHLFLVPDYVPAMLTKDLFHWRNKRLFPSAESTAVSRIEWKSGKAGAVVAVRAGEGWRLEKPRNVLASRVMFEGLGSTLSYAAAKSLVASDRNSPEGKKAIAGKPSLEIRFGLNDGDQHQLRLFPKAGGERSKQALALVDGRAPVYAVDASTFDRFEMELANYRQRAVLDDPVRGSVDEATLRFPREKKEITLQLKDGKWVRTAGAETPGPLLGDRVAGFLDQLRDAEFKAFLPANGPSPEAKAWKHELPDLEAELKAAGKPVYKGRFLVHDRKQALTESEGDVRSLGDRFLKLLPVRLADLTEAANQTVVTKEEAGHGNDTPVQQPAAH